MKLIIQIPCLNEEEFLPVTLKDLPRDVPGFSEVEWLVIDEPSCLSTYWSRFLPVALAMRSHLFPFRIQKLSSSAPMVLPG